MYCSQCGKQNEVDARFCVQCGASLGEIRQAKKTEYPGKNAIRMDFTVENRVNVNLAIAALLIGILGAVFSFIGSVAAFSSAILGIWQGVVAGGLTYRLSLLTNITVMVLQTIVIFQWSNALNTNIENTRLSLNALIKENPGNSDFSEMEYRIRSLKLEPWTFWVYFVFYFLGTVTTHYGWLLNLFGFVFLGIYLQKTFTTATRLQDYKESFYTVYRSSSRYLVRHMKSRNIFVTVLLIIITLGIYWWYILIAFSKEINVFLDTDKKIRDSMG
jgi:hypothetical protein